ncbi:MAG: ATPase, T2SS/T4P/T4SS family [Myxococcaceae bacterium]
MLVISVAEKDGETQQYRFDKSEVTLGRLAGNDIVLSKGNVSKVHARIVNKDGKFVIVDMRSTNGTYVNGKKISAPQVIRQSDRVHIGDYVLNVEPDAEADTPELPELSSTGLSQNASGVHSGLRDVQDMRARLQDDVDVADSEDVQHVPSSGASEDKRHETHEPAVRAQSPQRERRPASPALPTAVKQPALTRMPASMGAAMARRGTRGMGSTDVQRYAQLQKDIHDRLIEYLDLRRLDMERLGDEELWRRTEKAIRDIVDQMEQDRELPDGVDREELLGDVLNEALGLGPLEAFLANEEISEIMVNHANQIYIERRGKLTLSEKTFSSNQAVLGIIERIVAPIGRRIDESSPLVDARLKDGSRVNAIIPPLALKGPCLTIRKFKRDALKIGDLVRYKTLTPQMAEFLEMCVKARKNIVISGGTGSGKTTTLNIISSFIPEGERIVTVEDAAELQLPQEHWVQLEARPPNLEGKGAIAIRDLVKNCLRMRPDRIVVGECRGGEALDMLQAMNTGHDGSLTTLHANTPRDAVARLETMVLMSGMELPIKAIREQIASAVQIIVQQTRFSDGTRKVAFITELSGMEVDIVTLQDIFFYKQEGFTEDGRIRGRFCASGFVPKFYDDLQRRGIPVNMGIFRED